MRKLKLIIFIAVLCGTCSQLAAQKVALKNNLLYDATATPNLQLELGLTPKTTLELGVGVNPFNFSDNKKFKHWLFQPEYRYWLCERFSGHFFGVHAHGGQFNVGNWDIPIALDVFKNHRYEGYFYGAGLSYGYQWVLSPRWNIEANIGGGYARIHYDKFPCAKCGTRQDKGKHNYWGVTKAAVSVVYFLK